MTQAFNFLMSSRVVAGENAMDQTAQLCRDIGIRKLLVVTDSVIQKTPFMAKLKLQLVAEFESLYTFDECGIDARVAQVNEVCRLITEKGIDGVLGVGGGSVICTAKAAALAVMNGSDCYALKGKFKHDAAPLRTVMIPTTAGSGSEVSQFSIVKDDARHEKFSVGGPQCFPTLAILDPATLATLPQRPAALAAIDALTHAVEAMFTDTTSPVSDALALSAIEMLGKSIRPSILKGDPSARLDNLIGSSLANMACGNARLGLCHVLSWPLESEFGLAHGQGMASLLSVVFAFNAEVAPDRAIKVASALGFKKCNDAAEAITYVTKFLEELYSDLGIGKGIPLNQIDVSRLQEMVGQSVFVFSRGRTVAPLPHNQDTLIVSPNIRPATIAQGAELLRLALAKD
jgi:alcohol dehydrogenase class IV